MEFLFLEKQNSHSWIGVDAEAVPLFPLTSEERCRYDQSGELTPINTSNPNLQEFHSVMSDVTNMNSDSK